MNQKIYELMLKAGYENPHKEDKVHDLVKSVIEECCQYLDDIYYNYCSAELKKEFTKLN